MTTERRYDIDWLRVITIGLLLIYHIAIIFQPWAMFLGFIRSNEAMTDLWKAMTVINIWRIPILFFVSGMGVYFAIRKRTWKELILERSKRILLPFLFGIVAIVPLHIFIFQRYYQLPLSYEAHQAHLWFLGNIFTYVLLLSPLFFFLKNNEHGKFRKVLSQIMNNPLGPMIVAIFFIAEVMIMKPQIFEMYALNWHGYFLGLLAFLFGFLFVYTGDSFWKTVLKYRWLYTGVALILYTLRITLFDMNAPGYLMSIESTCWILGIFGFGYRYLNRPSHLLRNLSSAAYPVYIIHMVALYAGAAIILPLQLPVMVKFLAIVAFTGIFCYVVYEFIIRRIGFLRPLFGLKWEGKKDVKILPETVV